jgi:hypothetical protein
LAPVFDALADILSYVADIVESLPRPVLQLIGTFILSAMVVSKLISISMVFKGALLLIQYGLKLVGVQAGIFSAEISTAGAVTKMTSLSLKEMGKVAAWVGKQFLYILPAIAMFAVTSVVGKRAGRRWSIALSGVSIAAGALLVAFQQLQFGIPLLVQGVLSLIQSLRGAGEEMKKVDEELIQILVESGLTSEEAREAGTDIVDAWNEVAATYEGSELRAIAFRERLEELGYDSKTVAKLMEKFGGGVGLTFGQLSRVAIDKLEQISEATGKSVSQVLSQLREWGIDTVHEIEVVMLSLGNIVPRSMKELAAAVSVVYEALQRMGLAFVGTEEQAKRVQDKLVLTTWQFSSLTAVARNVETIGGVSVQKFAEIVTASFEKANLAAGGLILKLQELNQWLLTVISNEKLGQKAVTGASDTVKATIPALDAAALAWEDFARLVSEAGQVLHIQAAVFLEGVSSLESFRKAMESLTKETIRELLPVLEYVVERLPALREALAPYIAAYAGAAIPRMQKGGYVERTGLYILEAGEVVLPRGAVAEPVPTSFTVNVNISQASIRSEADIDLLARSLSERIRLEARRAGVFA